MYIKKRLGQRMEPSEALGLYDYYCEDNQSRNTRSHLLLTIDNFRQNFIRHDLSKKSSISNPLKILEYIEYYSLGTLGILKPYKLH